MTEKEKMLAGEYYLPSDPELANERSINRNNIRILNSLNQEGDEYEALLYQILGTCGKDAWIVGPFFCDYGYNIHVGDNFYANYNFTVLDCAKVTIGNNVLIGPNVSILTPVHPIDKVERRTLLEFSKPVTIEDDVWIAGDVTILGGVTIGEGAVIGAGSVVTKDIPNNVLAAGNPCRVIRKINE